VPTAVNHVRAYDFVFDICADGDAARHVDSQTLARELVNDRQTLQDPSFASSASISKGGPRSKENGPDVSLHWAISATRLP
jgi:hypothetical protein